MAEKLIEQVYVKETLEEVEAEYKDMYRRSSYSLIFTGLILCIFAFVFDREFGNKFWLFIAIGGAQIVWAFINPFVSTRRAMKQYRSINPKPMKVSIYENYIEIYVESNLDTVCNSVKYDEMKKIIYNEKKHSYYFYRKRSSFKLYKRCLSKDTIEFLNTKLKG